MLNERYSFLKPAVHFQFKTDKQYDAKRELSSQTSINITHTLFYNLNKVFGIERRRPSYTMLYVQTNLIMKCTHWNFNVSIYHPFILILLLTRKCTHTEILTST